LKRLRAGEVSHRPGQKILNGYHFLRRGGEAGKTAQKSIHPMVTENWAKGCGTKQNRNFQPSPGITEGHCSNDSKGKLSEQSEGKNSWTIRKMFTLCAGTKQTAHEEWAWDWDPEKIGWTAGMKKN